MTDDECGDLYESLIDDETAMFEMAHLAEIPLDETAGSVEEDDQVRRLRIFGADDRRWTTNRAWPQSTMGLVKFKDRSGRGKICSGTKVSKKHILTAGHCCHGGPGSGFYKDWTWHPAA